jgi:hypothetical protein
MAFQFAPLLIGAGMGALGGLLTGRDPLRSALVGGATGGLLGSIPAFGAGGVGATGATATSAKLASIDPASVNAFTSGASIAPSYAGTLGSTGELGANMAFSSAPASTMFSSVATDPMTGQILASQVPNTGVSAFTQQPSMFDSLSDTLSPYFNARDMGNVALQSFAGQQQQMPQASAGGVTRGQAPQAQDVMALLASIKQPERRRISLM